MSNNHSNSPTLTGQSTPAQQGPEIGSAVSLTDIFPPIPRAPPTTPQRTLPPAHNAPFPPYIYINYEAYMRTANPFWEPERQATSCMYTSTRNDQAGRLTCSQRMSQWLDQLPEPDSARRQAPLVPHRPRQQRQNNGQLATNNNTRRAHPLNISIIEPPQLPDNVTSSSLQHPNPLRQHPVRGPQEEDPTPLRIPKRKSSLQHDQFRDPFLDPEQSTVPSDEELVQGIQAINLGHPVEFLGSERCWEPPVAVTESSVDTQVHYDIVMSDAPSPATPAHPSNDATARDGNNSSKPDPVVERLALLLGPLDSDSGNKKKKKKRERRETSAMSEAPSKRLRTSLANVRNRLSQVGGGGVGGSGDDGRRSRAGARNPKRNSMPSGRNPLSAVVDFPRSADEHYRIKICFVGNRGCGKTKMIDRFFHGTFHKVEALTATEVEQGYACVPEDRSENAVTPLLSTFFDAVVVCYDIQDETTLRAAASKWSDDAERYVPSAPVILVGLKADLRPSFPTLKLTHLNEPNATSIGQGEQAAKAMGAVGFFECSASTGEGVVDFFESTIRYCLQRRRSHNPGPLKKVKNFFRACGKKMASRR